MASTRAPLNPLAENSVSAAARIRSCVRRGSRVAAFPESISTEPESFIESNRPDTMALQVTVKLLSRRCSDALVGSKNVFANPLRAFEPDAVRKPMDPGIDYGTCRY